MPRPVRETELYPAVRDFLATQGYVVRGEVDGCDVAAVRGEDLVIVELKRFLSVDLLAQGVRRQRIADAVYLAIPRPASAAGERRLRALAPLVGRLELGLLTVDPASGVVDVRLQPLAAQRRRQPRRRSALLAEIAGRPEDSPGGTHARRVLTAYRENAVAIGCALERLGPATPAALRSSGTGPRTLSILRGNAYGWFERVDRGVYGLTATGARELLDWPAAIERARARLAFEDPAATTTSPAPVPDQPIPGEPVPTATIPTATIP